jgi:hypothetical protein
VSLLILIINFTISGEQNLVWNIQCELILYNIVCVLIIIIIIIIIITSEDDLMETRKFENDRHVPMVPREVSDNIILMR